MKNLGLTGMIDAVRQAERLLAAATPARNAIDQLLERNRDALRDAIAVHERDARQRVQAKMDTIARDSTRKVQAALTEAANSSVLRVTPEDLLRAGEAAAEAQRLADAPAQQFIRDLSQQLRSPLPPLPKIGDLINVTFSSGGAEVVRQTMATFTSLHVPTVRLRAPGELVSDFLDACDGDTEAMQRLARRLAAEWRFYDNATDRQARTAISVRAESEEVSPSTIKERELLAALILVLPERHHPQRIRSGNTSVTGEDGRLLAPEDLPWRLFWRWLRSRAFATARYSLLSSAPLLLARDTVSLDTPNMPDLADDDAADPLQQLVIAETIGEVWALASPQQRRLLTYLRAGYQIQEAAQKMGVEATTARQHLFRLRTSARRLLRER